MSFDEWREGVLDDIALIIMGQSPAGETCNEHCEGIPLLNGPTEFGFSNPIPTQYTSDPKKIADVSDLLFCVRGSTTGRMNWADQKYAIGRGLAAIRHKNGIELQPFLRAVLEYNLSTLLAEATGSTFPNVSSQQLKGLKIKIPLQHTQFRIATILSALDDKINLNQETNQTLETIVQSIFKEWFVNFNFPDSTREMKESELGDIPKEWMIGELGDLLELQRGFDLPSTKRIIGNIPVIAASGFNGYHNEFKIKAPGITTGRSGVLGNVFYIQEDFWPLNTSLYIKKFKGATPLFSYFLLKGIDLKSMNGGSAVPTLNRNEVHKVKTIIPQQSFIQKFERVAISFFQKIKNNEDQIQTLTELRDILLPKLVKGEIPIAEIEKHISSVI